MSSEASGRQEFKVLGICGGIGSGKSSASKLLVSELGCLDHLDADSVAHSVYTPGSQAVRDIVAAFGSGILQTNGEEIDRKKLGSIVFADRSEMEKLERIVWPHVKKVLTDRIDDSKAAWEEGKTDGSLPIVVLEAAVLLDAEWDDLLDGIWVVTAPISIAMERLMETRGLSKEEAQKRISAQESRRGIGNLDMEISNGIVTGVIKNEGGLDDLKGALSSALNDPQYWK